MNGEILAFLVLAIVLLAGAVSILFLQKIVHALLAAVLTFTGIAGLYVLLTAEFVAGAQILIYSGSISILLLFAIMLTNHKTNTKKAKSPVKKTLIFLTVALFGALVYNGISDIYGYNSPASFHENNTEQIGTVLFSKYFIAFELISVLLLAALVGAIILAKKEEE